jgi:hypothetical protein
VTAIDYVGLVSALGIYGYCVWVLCRFLGLFSAEDDDDPPDPY